MCEECDMIPHLGAIESERKTEVSITKLKSQLKDMEVKLKAQETFIKTLRHFLLHDLTDEGICYIINDIKRLGY